MIEISRRDFIHAGCVVAASSLVPEAVEAALHGSVPGNPNRVTLNVYHPLSAANLAKNFSWQTQNQTYGVHPSILDANGYPKSTPAVAVGSNPSFPGYFGDFVWSWSGRGSMQFSPACIIRSTQLNGVGTNGVVTNVVGQSGDTQYNTRIIDQTSPRVVMAFGALIQGMSAGASNGAGGNYIRITFKTGYVNQFSGIGVNNQIKIQNSTVNGNLVGQSNAVDTWNYVQVGATDSIDLTTSTTTGAVSAYSSGSPWVSGGEAITSASNMTVYLLAQGTFTNFTNLVFCQSANEAAVLGGQINDPTLRDQYKYLMNHASAPMAQRGWLRWMDLTGVNQGSYESDFANRLPVTSIAYANNEGNYFCPANITTSGSAAITWSAGDAYACADATKSVWSGSAYIDNAVIQGVLSATNTGANPTLNVGAHGAKPIFDQTTNPCYFAFTTAPTTPGTDILNFTFNVGGAAWLNGGANYTFSYTTVAGDATLSTLVANLKAAIQSNSVLSSALIRPETSGNNLVVYARTAQANGVAGTPIVLTYSGSAGCTVTRIPASNMTASGASFIYSQILGGWIYRPGGIAVSTPAEAIVELCNQVGAHCWYCLPVYSTSAYVTALTQFFADSTTGLTSGLRFGTEVGNELWNFSLQSYGACQYLGYAMGFAQGAEIPQWGWGALRTVQYSSLAKTAWTGKGRAAGDYYNLQIGRQSEAFPNQNFEVNGLIGTPLNTSNTVYASYGGLGGGAASNYSAAPNRPVDVITATGMAAYWYSDYIGEVANEIFGSVADNSQWLQASKDYTNGLTTAAFSSLANLFSLARGTATITSGSYNNATGVVTLTLAAPIIGGTLTVGDQLYVSGLTGTGAISSMSGYFTSISPSSGTTISYNAGAGKGATAITGGTVNDTAIFNQNQASNWSAFATFFANFETIVAAYDAPRASNGMPKLGILHYEAAPQWSVGNNLTNGTNGTGSTNYQYLVTRMTNLGWNVNTYDALGATGAAAITNVANQVVNMIQAWKLDTDRNGNPANTASYKSMIKQYHYQALVNASAGKGREVKPAQYGYENNTWGLFPVSWRIGGQYSSYDAIHEFNA